MGKLRYNVDNWIENGDSWRIRGWAYMDDQHECVIRLLDARKMPLPAMISRTERKDVDQETGADGSLPAGFVIDISKEAAGKKKVWLEITADGRTYLRRYRIPYSEAQREQNKKPAGPLMEKLMGITIRGRSLGYLIRHGRQVAHTYGMVESLRRLRSFAGRKKDDLYKNWIEKYEKLDERLEEQKAADFGFRPLISVVVPVYRTPEHFLRDLIRSMKAQTYDNWELCLADASGSPSPLAGFLAREEKEDPRIRSVQLASNGGISENTNEAIKIARGEYIAFCDHDDTLAPHAMYEIVKALNEHPDADVLYSDEDKIDADKSFRYDPNFKPDFNMDLLASINYICHLFVAKRSLLDKVGLLRKEYDGSQDHDLILRACEEAGQIVHIPEILYHWRSHASSTAEDPESKMYCYEAGRRAVQAHYDRAGIPAEVSLGEVYGTYRTRFLWEEKPLVSIIIPNKDHTDDLDKCVRSIQNGSTYRNLEFIIVENNSEKEETFRYYEKLSGEFANVKVVRWEESFNFSKINNFGVKHASGEYLLLLNNDTELIAPDAIGDMLGYCMRSDVGAVGARLYFGDNTIQHAGVVIGYGGFAGHCFVNEPRTSNGYMSRIICACDYSAVTAACLMTKRSAFEAVGGLTESFEIALNDIDYCLKLREKQYTIVYDPWAEFYHYESKSRGLDAEDPEKNARLQAEVKKFRSRWSGILEEGDPYYNPNLSLVRQDYSVKE